MSQSNPTASRDAFSVAVIGSGMSGLLMGKQLKDAGVDFTIYEKAGEVGGTWRENTYPGLSCDVPAHYYSYSFEPNPSWDYRFARGYEIQNYLKSVCDRYGLREHIRFNAEVSGAKHDGERWQLDASGQPAAADLIVAATGVLHHPRMPDIKNLDAFEGPSFHSARWDHSVDLKNKRIGVIGAGSTAVQIITELGGQGHDVLSFQRTPQWIFPMPDRRYLAAEQSLMRRIPKLSILVHRIYEQGFERVMARAVIKPCWQRRMLNKQVRRNLASIKDAALRETVTPPDEPGCKRLIMSNKYYKVIQQDNVEIVRDGVVAATPNAVVTGDGRHHEVDVLVLATGFQSHDYMRPMELEAADGTKLSEVWAHKPHAYRTIAVPGIPDFFMLQGPRSPVGNFSLISIAQTQSDYIMKCVNALRSGQVRTLIPKPDVAKRLELEMNDSMGDTIWLSGCNSWYLDADGLPDSWPSTPAHFREYLSQLKLDEYQAA